MSSGGFHGFGTLTGVGTVIYENVVGRDATVTYVHEDTGARRIKGGQGAAIDDQIEKRGGKLGTREREGLGKIKRVERGEVDVDFTQTRGGARPGLT